MSFVFRIRSKRTLRRHAPKRIAASGARDVQVHNAHVRTRRNRVLDIVGQFVKSARDPSGKNAPDAETTACALFALYRKRRIADTFDTLVNVTLPAAALKEARLNDVVSIMGKNGAQTIRLKFGNVPWSGWIPTQWPRRRIGHPANLSSSSAIGQQRSSKNL